MSTTNLRVEFSTRRLADVPRAGQRKAVRVNGRIETMYVRRVEVEAVKEFDDRGRIHMEYDGVAVMCEHDRLFR